MELFKRRLKIVYDFFKDEKVPMDEKNFYLVMISCVPIYLMLSVAFVIRKYDFVVVTYSLTMILFVVLVAFLAKFTHSEKILGTLFCCILNFFIIPIYFFVTGDIFNGATIFFTLSIIVTVFLHTQSKILYPLVILELLSDGFYIYFVYRNSDLFEKTRSIVSLTNTVTTCFILVAISATLMCLYQTFIYNIAKKKLDDANRDISIAESSKSRFLANMTHEIRTPMNAIIGMTNLILKEELSDEARDQVNVVKNASSDLLRIINDILEYSKFDSGKVNLINTEYNISKLINGTVEAISKEYFKDNITLQVFVSCGIPSILFGDDVRIRQVFNYILFSSLSRSSYGHVYIDIDGDIDEINKTVEIKCKVSSTGTGFSTAELNSMFNAYTDYDSRQKSSFKGMGLELNICKAILELMEGNMELQSIEGIGTSVQFSFKNYVIDKTPIAYIRESAKFKPLIFESNVRHENRWQKLFSDFKVSASYTRNVSHFKSSVENTKFSHIFVDEHDYDMIKDHLNSYACEDITYVISSQDKNYGDFGECRILRAPLYSINLMEAVNNTWKDDKYVKETEKEIVTYPGARVLAVDDSTINLKVIESLLSGYEIIPRLAQSGREALDILKREQMDLLLLDQKMPEFDGIDTIHALRESDCINKDIPAVCVTADFGADTKTRLVEEGFNDYLAKPINLVYFDKVIYNLLPKKLRKVVKESETINDNSANAKNDNTADVNNDAPVFDPNIGISNLAGSKDAYLAVLLEYYKEGCQKIECVPMQLAEGNVSLYTTNVHALKSSSATVGAMRISPLFKELEFAGKDNNIDFINSNTDKTLNMFKDVLSIVKEYLISENAYEEESEEVIVEGEESVLDMDQINVLLNSINTMNLRVAEETINQLCVNNYGSELNKKLKNIKDAIDSFEYIEAKTIIESIIA